MNYYTKYLKYKNKYNKLKEFIGGSNIDINFKNNDKLFTLNDIDKNIKIIELKNKLSEKTNESNVNLIFNDKELDDNLTINEYNINNNDTINYFIKNNNNINNDIYELNVIIIVKLLIKIKNDSDSDTQYIMSFNSKNHLLKKDDDILKQVLLDKIDKDKKNINIILIDEDFFKTEKNNKNYIRSGNSKEIIDNIQDLELENAQIYGLAALESNIPDITDYNKDDEKIIKLYTKPINKSFEFVSRYKNYYNSKLSIINEALKEKKVNFYVIKFNSSENGIDHIKNLIKDFNLDKKIII